MNIPPLTFLLIFTLLCFCGLGVVLAFAIMEIHHLKRIIRGEE